EPRGRGLRQPHEVRHGVAPRGGAHVDAVPAVLQGPDARDGSDRRQVEPRDGGQDVGGERPPAAEEGARPGPPPPRHPGPGGAGSRTGARPEPAPVSSSSVYSGSVRTTCASPGRVSSSTIRTHPSNLATWAKALGLRASKSSTTRGRPCVMSATPATPPVWN